MGDAVHEILIQITNQEGLHMRPAMLFVDVAGRFDSEITVSKDDTVVDAKSIMQMTMLAATCGTKLKIVAQGTDADKAIESLRNIVEKQLFDESPKAPAGEK